MLTVLSIEDKTRDRKYRGLRDLLSVNSLRIEEKSAMGINVRQIRYINRSGRINWQRISRKAGDGRKQLIYSGRENVPHDVGISLFSPTELRCRLCANMGIELLREMKEVPKNLRIGLYDPEGEAADVAQFLLKFTDNVVVVTGNFDVYSACAENLLAEFGAVLCVSKRPATLGTCGLIIAPAPVDVAFTPMSSAVVLTCQVPKVSIPCFVYHRYSFELPKEMEELYEEGVDRDVIAGALYSLCGIYHLGSVVPLVCSGSFDTRTALSLSKYLTDNFGT